MAIEAILNEAISTFNERNEKYGDAYKDQGHIVSNIFGKVTLENGFDVSRFSLMGALIVKYRRYVEGFRSHEFHRDDLIDIICYTAMLMEIGDEEANANSSKHISE